MNSRTSFLIWSRGGSRRWYQPEDGVSREFCGNGLVGCVRGGVEVGPGDANLGDVLAHHRDGVLGSSFLNLVRLRVAAAAERDLAGRARVKHPVRGPVAGDQPAVATRIDHVDRGREKPY